MKPNVVDVNVQTGEQTVREMTDEEYADYLVRQDEASADQSE
jgi:hypothetical protein